MAEVYESRSLNRKIVRDDAVKRGMQGIVEARTRKAQAILAAHYNEGESRIEHTLGSKKVDHYITLVDDAALSIEFGRRPSVRQGKRGTYVDPGFEAIAPLRKAVGIRA